MLILKDVKERVEHMTNTLYEITDFGPIMAISRYTAPEIQDICRRLELPLVDATGKKLAKRALYDMAEAQISIASRQLRWKVARLRVQPVIGLELWKMT